jgi:hypothetical protein
VIYDGKALTEIYGNVGRLINIKGELAYAYNGQVFLGREKVGESYDAVWDLTDFNGIFGFVAKKGNHQYVIMGGKKVSHKEPYQVENLWNIGGKPVIMARRGNLYWMIHGDEQKGGVYEGESHREDGRLILNGPINNEKVLDCGGKLAFIVEKLGKEIGDAETSVIFDGEEIGKYKSHITDFIQHRGKPAFIVGSGGSETVIVGEEQKWKFPGIYHLTSIGNRLAFTVAEGREKPRYVVLDGEQIGEKHDGMSLLTDVAGKLAYSYSDCSSSDGASYGVVYDQKELSFLTVYHPQMKEVIVRWGKEYLPTGGQSALEKSLSKIKLTNTKELAQFSE